MASRTRSSMPSRFPAAESAVSSSCSKSSGMRTPLYKNFPGRNGGPSAARLSIIADQDPRENEAENSGPFRSWGYLSLLGILVQAAITCHDSKYDKNQE